MNNTNKETLLAEFREFLNAYDGPLGQAENDDNPRQIDLYTLFCEVAALKNEVRVEARQFKKALSSIDEIVATSDHSQRTLRGELERSRNDGKRQLDEALKPLLIQLLDIRDRIEAGCAVATKNSQSKLPIFGGERRIVAALARGLELTLRRFDQLLESYQITAVATQNKILDPHTMRAADIVSLPSEANGAVVAELRKGFQWNDKILRVAEVRVNKVNDNEEPCKKQS